MTVNKVQKQKTKQALFGVHVFANAHIHTRLHSGGTHGIQKNTDQPSFKLMSGLTEVLKWKLHVGDLCLGSDLALCNLSMRSQWNKKKKKNNSAALLTLFNLDLCHS